MTFKLNPEIRKIASPVVLVFPDGTEEEHVSGLVVAEAVFDHRYSIESLRAVKDVIHITLAEQEAPVMNWIGEEEVSFF